MKDSSPRRRLTVKNGILSSVDMGANGRRSYLSWRKVLFPQTHQWRSTALGNGRSYQDGSHTGLENGYRGKQNKEFSIDAGADATTDATKSYAALTANKIVAKHKAYNKMRDKMMVGKVLPWIHISISNAKRSILDTYHDVKADFLQLYLNEFSYKFNRRYFTCSTGLNFAHAIIERVSSIESTDLDDCGYSFF